ncbi:MAG: penicillin acylase family protein [Saprospiraceae bacterium]|nr:penicillin acylase family protein [Saprospiraceae bacterium]
MNAMGKYVSLILRLLFPLCWMWLMNASLQIKGNGIPPLGSFFSPATGFWWNAHYMDEDQPDVMQFDGVRGEVVLDERKVPHIFAEDDRQAYFIQGYLHAMHRLWQMDFSTRAAEGRISEIVGDRALEFDKLKRRKGLPIAARMSVENWKKDSFLISRLESYVRGVNAYISEIQEHELPIEYKILNYKPEPWSLYRSALFHKSMAEILCGRDKDVELTNAKAFFKEDFAELFPEMDPLTDPVIPSGTSWNRMDYPVLKAYEDSTQIGFLPFLKESSVSGLGSNNWAVSPQMTQSGSAILCNDPHLSLTLPSIWYEQQISTPEYNVYGVTFPGIAGVVIGFNKHMAWGVTNAGWDVLDWYKIHWKDSTMVSYLMDGEWKLTNVRLDTILVKGKGYVIDTVRLTHWGPVIHTDPKHKKYSLAMHWILHDSYDQMEFRTFMSLNRAKNYDDYRKACTYFPYPAQNIVFASVSGDIAMTVSGNMPVKYDQQGRFIMDGSSARHKWAGILDPLQNPAMYNPSRGFVSSANQRSTDLNFPVYYNDGDFRSYRGLAVNRLLAQKNNWDVQSMKELQYNNLSLEAEFSLPVLMALLDSSKLNVKGREIVNQLRKWNFNYDSSSMAPVYFDLWFEYLQKMVWDELSPFADKMSIAFPNDQILVKWMLEKPHHPFFDYQKTTQKEQAKDIVQIAFDSVLYFLEKEPPIRDWADYKAAEIVHIARIPAFGKFQIRSSGNEDIINAHARIFGPSWRMIVELKKDSMVAYGIYPGGQCGHPGSAYYDHTIEPWARGEYFRLHYWNAPPENHKGYFKIHFQ